MVLCGRKYAGTCQPLKVAVPAETAVAPAGSVVAEPSAAMGTTGELVNACEFTCTRMWNRIGSGMFSVTPPTPVPRTHCWCVPALGMPQPSSACPPGRSPSASWCPASGLGRSLHAPYCDLRTAQARGGLGLVMGPPWPSFQPGRRACGITRSWVNGWVMKGLVANGSTPTPQPVKAISPIGIGVLSMQAAACARAPLPITVAAPPIAPTLIRSRRVNLFFDMCTAPLEAAFSAALNLYRGRYCTRRAARNYSSLLEPCPCDEVGTVDGPQGDPVQPGAGPRDHTGILRRTIASLDFGPGFESVSRIATIGGHLPHQIFVMLAFAASLGSPAAVSAASIPYFFILL